MFSFTPFMRIAGWLGLIFGVQLLLVPAFTLQLNGVHTDSGGIMLARLSGAVLIEAGLTQILIATSSDTATRRGGLISGLIGSVAGLAVTLSMQVTHVAGLLGWMNVLVYGFLLGGFVMVLAQGRR